MSERMTIGDIEAQEAKAYEVSTDPTADMDVLEIVDVNYTEADRKLTDFVSKNVMLMQEHLLQQEIPDIQHVNKAYIDSLPTAISLNRLYQKVRLNAAKAKEKLELFDDQAMDQTKKELNREDNKRTWYSSTELKAAAHTKYKAKYAQLRAQYDLAEGRRSFIERLCNAWDSWQFSLGQISRNLIAEAHANGLDMKGQNYMPADPDEMRIDQLAEQAMNFNRPAN